MKLVLCLAPNKINVFVYNKIQINNLINNFKHFMSKAMSFRQI